MKEGLLSDDKLKSSYLALKNVSELVKKDYNKLIKENFQDEEWRREGRKIDINLKKYEKILKDVERILDNAKGNENVSEDSISVVEEGVEQIKENLEPMIRAMNEKIGQFDTNFEMESKGNEGENEEEQEQEQGQITMNLMENDELLKKRKENLQEIHKISGLIKDTTDKMVQEMDKQGEQLNVIETHIDNAEKNVEVAHKEINKANELSKGNNRRNCIIIIIVVVVVAVILAVVLSQVFKKKD